MVNINPALTSPRRYIKDSLFVYRTDGEHKSKLVISAYICARKLILADRIDGEHKSSWNISAYFFVKNTLFVDTMAGKDVLSETDSSTSVELQSLIGLAPAHSKCL